VTSTSASQASRPARTHTELGFRLGLAGSATATLNGLHVLVVGIDYHPLSHGIAPYTTGLAAHLATAAADVTVLAGIPRHPDGQVPAPYRSGLRFADPGWCQPEGPRVIRLRPGSSEAGGPIRQALHDVGFFLNALAAGRGVATDLVIGVTPNPSAAAAAAFLARRAGVPLITVVQGTTRDAAGAGRSRAVDRAADRIGAGPAPVRRRGRLGPPARLITYLTARLSGSMEHYALRCSAEVAVTSEAFRPAALAAGVDPQRLHRLPNWIRSAPATESRQSAREALGWPLDRFTVVYAAPIGPRQDLGTAIAAARLLLHRSEAISGGERRLIDHDLSGPVLADWDRAVLAGAVDLVVVGDGSQRGALEQQAFGLSNVRFLDPPDADSHPLVLAAADVLLIAESAAGDVQGTAGLLAGYLSAGRPVLAAAEDTGPTACELRRTGGAGLRVPPGDPSALAEAILSLQPDALERRAMGAAALRYARSQLGKQVSLRRLDLVVEAALSQQAAGAQPSDPDGTSAAGPLKGSVNEPVNESTSVTGNATLNGTLTESADGPGEGVSTNGPGAAIHSRSHCRYQSGRNTVDHPARDTAGPTARKGR
jgi:colanic acid biosynthesis glycosyl transferase WcaI